MQSCFPDVASLQSVPIQLTVSANGNTCTCMLKPVLPDFIPVVPVCNGVQAFKYLNIFLPYLKSIDRLTITSPLFLRCVNQCRPFVDKAVARQRLYMSSLIRAYTVANSFVKSITL